MYNQEPLFSLLRESVSQVMRFSVWTQTLTNLLFDACGSLVDVFGEIGTEIGTLVLNDVWAFASNLFMNIYYYFERVVITALFLYPEVFK